MSADETTARDDAEGTRGFAFIIGQLGDGDLADEIARKQRKLIETLTGHAYHYKSAAKGRITVEIAFTVDDDGVVEARGSVKVKEPPPKSCKATLWATKGGNLTAANAKQGKLNLREVPVAPPVRDLPPRGEVKEIGQ